LTDTIEVTYYIYHHHYSW